MTPKPTTQWITGTAIMSALVVVLDYTLKFSGVKIPFPMLPTLKFDLDGIPIILTLFLYGPYSALTTCFVAFTAILARSGAALSASMKALAELGTVLGLLPFYRTNSKRFKLFGIVSGTVSRILIMVGATLTTWPLIFQSEQAALAFLPFLAIFNAVAAVISISGGYLIYRALVKRAPALLPTSKQRPRSETSPYQDHNSFVFSIKSMIRSGFRGARTRDLPTSKTSSSLAVLKT